MKKFSLHLLLAFGISALGFLAMPAFAQDAAKIQELQRVIDAQQRQNKSQQSQIEAQQKQLDAQRQLLQNLQKQMESLAKDADTKEVPVAAEKPAFGLGRLIADGVGLTVYVELVGVFFVELGNRANPVFG